MISSNEKNKFKWLLTISSLLLVADFITLTVNINIAPVLDGIGMPDIFIYIKTFFSLVLFVISLLFLKSKRFKIYKSHMVLIGLFAFSSIIFYAFSLFIYKFFLLNSTLESIKFMVQGSPSFYVYYSLKHYHTIKYVAVIYGNLNSDFVIMCFALGFGYWLNSLKTVEIETGITKNFDSILINRTLYLPAILTVILSFLSINIFKLSYTLTESFEVALSLLSFMFTIPLIYYSTKLKNIHNYTNERLLKSLYLGIKYLSLFAVIINIALFGLHIYMILNSMATYRYLTVITNVYVLLYLFIKSFKPLSLI